MKRDYLVRGYNQELKKIHRFVVSANTSKEAAKIASNSVSRLMVLGVFAEKPKGLAYLDNIFTT